MRVDAGADAVVASGGESGKEGEKKKDNISQTSGYLYLMRDANYRLQIFKFMFMWFSVSLTYYLISFNTRTLSGDINMNMVYLGLVDAVAYPIAATVMITLGRKKAAVLYFTTGACFILSLITVELAGVMMENKSFYITMLSLMAKFCFVSGWATCKGFTGESFPTTMRSSAYGICRIASSIGGILAPQILFLGTYNRAIPYAVVGCVAVTSAIITLTLKETKGKPIAED